MRQTTTEIAAGTSFGHRKVKFGPIYVLLILAAAIGWAYFMAWALLPPSMQ